MNKIHDFGQALLLGGSALVGVLVVGDALLRRGYGLSMPSGYVGILTFELHMPDGASLKGKRRHLLHTKAQLERRSGRRWPRSTCTTCGSDRGLTWPSSGASRRARQALEDAERYLSSQDYELVACTTHRHVPVEERAVSERMRKVNEALRHVLADGVEEPGRPRPRLRHGHRRQGRPTSATPRSTSASSGRRSGAAAGLRALDRAHGVLQGRVAKELHLKRTPQLSFHYDETSTGRCG